MESNAQPACHLGKLTGPAAGPTSETHDRRKLGLALVGVVELIAVDLANVVAIALANGHGKTGAIVLFNYGSQVFNSIAAILALSIVVSAFPVLSAREGPEFDQASAGSTRAVLLMSWLGALALGTTIGQTVAAIPLVIVTRRICGRAAVRGASHAALAGLAACAAGAAVGVAVSMAVPIPHKLEAFALAVPAAGCAIIAFGVVAYLLDDGDLRSVLSWVRRVARRRS